MLRPLLWLLAPAVCHACTTVLLKTTRDGCTVVGRTMELAIPPETSELERIYLHARNTPVATARADLDSSRRTGRHAHNTTSRYGYLAIQITIGSKTFPSLATTEGINEAGLTVSAQVHVDASYEPVGPSTVNKTVTLFDVQTTAFLLGCCATIKEAAAALASVHVIATPLIGTIGKLHWSVQDRSGRSAVFEYIDESLKVFDNTEVGALTNDPSYEWHLGHLHLWAAYPSGASITPFAPTATSSGPFSSSAVPVRTDGSAGHVTSTTVPFYPGHGLNTRGLPSSYAPADRFAKMFLLKQTAMSLAPADSLDDGLVLITGLLNTVHIVRGTVTGPNHGGASGPLLEYTNWACMKVPWANANATSGGEGQGGPLFYYRTYDNMQWKRIELSRIDWSAGTAHKPIPLFEAGLGVKDTTPPH